MRFQTLLVLTAVLVVPISARAAEPVQMRPGLWEITVTMEMPGMPFQLPPTVTQQCVTPQEAKEQGMPPQAQDCTVTDMKRTGNKVTWKVACTGQTPGKAKNTTQTSAQARYQRDGDEHRVQGEAARGLQVAARRSTGPEKEEARWAGLFAAY